MGYLKATGQFISDVITRNPAPNPDDWMKMLDVADVIPFGGIGTKGAKAGIKSIKELKSFKPNQYSPYSNTATSSISNINYAKVPNIKDRIREMKKRGEEPTKELMDEFFKYIEKQNSNNILNFPSVSKYDLPKTTRKAIKEGKKDYINWLNSDEWLNRRMSATNETVEEANKFRKKAEEELLDTEIIYRSIDKYNDSPNALGMFNKNRFGIPNVNITVDINNPNPYNYIKSIANHEFGHAATVPLESSFDGIKFAKLDDYYYNLKEEQQIRAVRALNQLKQKGLWKGGNVSDEALDYLQSNKFNQIGGEAAREGLFDLQSWATMYKKEDLRNLMNTAYVLGGGAAATGAIASQQQYRNGGLVGDPPEKKSKLVDFTDITWTDKDLEYANENLLCFDGQCLDRSLQAYDKVVASYLPGMPSSSKFKKDYGFQSAPKYEKYEDY
ncbi:MAG: hypothetical protein ACW980_25355, partial [Promethearchaeota archaeon]